MLRIRESVCGRMIGMRLSRWQLFVTCARVSGFHQMSVVQNMVVVMMLLLIYQMIMWLVTKLWFWRVFNRVVI